MLRLRDGAGDLVDVGERIFGPFCGIVAGGGVG